MIHGNCLVPALLIWLEQISREKPLELWAQVELALQLPKGFKVLKFEKKNIFQIFINNLSQILGFEIGKIIYTATKPKPEVLLGPEYLQFHYVNFDQLLTDSDVIIVTAAYNEQTKEIFNKDAFKKMKKTAFIINNARGICFEK